MNAAPSATPAATFALTGLGSATKTAASERVIAAALTAGYGRPQPIGLNLADAVYVEYSDTLRLIALYQSAAAAQIAPIAQTRPADGPILGVLNPGYANAGGPVGFVKVLDQSTVSDLSSIRDPGSFTTTAAGLTTSVAALRNATAATPAPPPLFTFAGQGVALAKAAHAAHAVTVAVPGWPSVTWNYDPKLARWHTDDAVFSAESPSSLIFQQVAYKTVQLHHPGGALVPSARVFGRGFATAVSGPSFADGVWTKPGNAALTVYADANGVPLRFRPGVTWVLLLPAGSQVTYQ